MVEVHVPGAYVASKGTSCSRVCLVMSWPVPTIRTACPASSTTMGLQDHKPSLGVIASPCDRLGFEHEQEEP